ncbi:methionyl-tRNA synthetase [Aphanothece sacrum FPU1]|uniref:Methionyl-tRNA synthetase n=2 Tax=Aphanothece sacrum TaxID=1122 RepID=A0A401IC94_APHSA|nr:methionyl-tRNA synthetase [Aphanothece sacrum FPU1]GBF83118.1 methionyl-tRNA synthetase [Aphanothece sacrum FPU3]
MLGQCFSETKQQDLTQIVLEGICPHCRSNNIKFYEFRKNDLFGFKCQLCGWIGSYSSREFQEISNYWLTIA